MTHPVLPLRHLSLSYSLGVVLDPDLAPAFLIIQYFCNFQFRILGSCHHHYNCMLPRSECNLLNGAPIFTVLSGLGILLFWFDYVPTSAVIAEAYRIVVSPHLATIPLFTLAGYFLAESKASDRLINVFKALFGWLPGGTPVIVLLICGFFTALTGGSGVTILALGGLLFPMLIKDGYKKNFSLGLITASGSIGLLFPPSLPLILYGVTAGISIKSIFIAGILPGVFLIVVLSIWTIFSGELDKIEKHNFDLSKSLKACWKTKWELFIPLIVLYGIFGGHAKLVETAAFTAVYVSVSYTHLTLPTNSLV